MMSSGNVAFKILESLPTLSLFLTPDFEIINVSDGYVNATNIARSTIVGKNFLEFFLASPETSEWAVIQKFKNSVEQVIKTGRPDSMGVQRYDLPSKSDKNKVEIRFWNATNYPVLDNLGKVIYIINQVDDVTEDHIINTQLSNSKEQVITALEEIEYQKNLLYSSFEQAPVGIAIFSGQKFVIEICNQLACSIWNKSKDELIGKSVFEALPEAFHLGLLDTLNQVVSSGVPFIQDEVPVKLYENRKLVINYFNFICKLYNENKTTKRIIIIATNVTEQVEARHMLENKQKELLELNEHLAIAYKEIQLSNEELFQTQSSLNELNFNLEKNISVRTKELELSNLIAESNRDKLLNVFMQAPAVMAILKGPKHIFELANPLYMELVGGFRDIIGKTIRESLPEIEGQGFFELLDSVYQTGEPFRGNEIPVMLKRNNNETLEQRFVNFVYQPTSDIHANVDGILVHAVDVTEGVNSRKQIVESEEKYRTLFASMDQGFCIVELIFDENNNPIDYLFLETNPVFEKQCGLRDIEGRTAREAIPGLERRWFEIYGHIALTGVAKRFTEGSQALGRWFEAFAFRVGGSESRKVAILFTDITDRNHFEQSLKESEGRFRSMAEESEILISLSDEDNLATYYNKAWSKLTGRVEQDLFKSGWADLIHENDSHYFLSIYQSAFEKKSPWSAEFRILNMDGAYSWLYATGALRLRPDNSFAGYIISSIDITHRKEVEKAIEAKNLELQRINSELDNFIYTASHDLKAPISNLEGLLNALTSDVEFDEVQQHFINMMFQSIERFKNTIKDLTDISKLQREDVLATEVISFNTLLDEVTLDIRELIERFNPTIHTNFGIQTLNYSCKNLRSIIYNLLSNALKYSSSDRRPEISISTIREGKYVILEVKDNGLGLSPENQRKVFGMFKRAHQHIEGSGIGLYIIKKMVENAGGKIELQSTLNEGSTFKVYFIA